MYPTAVLAVISVSGCIIKMLRKLISIGLLVGSLVFASLIIFNKSETSNSLTTNTEPAFKIQDSQLPTAQTDKKLVASKDNSTSQISKSIAQEILARNPNGPELVDQQSSISVPDPETIVDKYLADGISNFNINDLKGSVNNAKLNVIADKSPEAIKNYFRDFRDILNNNFQSLKIDTDNLSFEKISQLVSAYNQAIKEFYILPVPQTLFAIHKEQISLMTAQRNIFSILENYNEDPLKALLAIQAFESIQKEVTALKTTVFNLTNNL